MKVAMQSESELFLHGRNDETHTLEDRDCMLTHIPEAIYGDEDIVEVESENQKTVENESGISRYPK